MAHRIHIPGHVQAELSGYLGDEALQKCHFYEEESSVLPQKILLLAANDTIAVSLSHIYKSLQHESVKLYPFYANIYPLEQGSRGFLNHGINAKAFSLYKLLKIRPDMVILGNDWDAYAKIIIWWCRRLNIKTTCIQESVIDLKDEKSKRMRWADFAVCQGYNSARQLSRDEAYVLANPRYELQGFSAKEGGKEVMVNCNFTYAVETDHREQWLFDVVSTLNQKELPYFVSVHPRDTAEVRNAKEVLRSNATKISDQLKRSSVLVSRFSSLLHEALIQGKKVIYYNPHKEEAGFEFYKDKSSFIMAETVAELTDGLRSAADSSPANELFFMEFSYPSLTIKHDLGRTLQNIKFASKGTGLPINPLVECYRVVVWILKKKIENIRSHKML